MFDASIQEIWNVVWPVIQWLIGMVGMWILLWFTGIIDRIKNSTLKSTIHAAIAFYYQNNIDDFVNRTIDEQLDLLCKEVQKRLEKRGIRIPIEKICDEVFITFIEMSDTLKRQYVRKTDEETVKT